MLLVIAVNIVIFVLVLRGVLGLGRKVRRRSSSIEEASRYIQSGVWLICDYIAWGSHLSISVRLSFDITSGLGCQLLNYSL